MTLRFDSSLSDTVLFFNAVTTTLGSLNSIHFEEVCLHVWLVEAEAFYLIDWGRIDVLMGSQPGIKQFSVAVGQSLLIPLNFDIEEAVP